MSEFTPLKFTTPSDLEIAFARAFDVPRPLLFDGLTKPDLIKQWLLGPPGWSMPVCDFDPKVGGAYRFQWSGPNGAAMGTRGVCREVVPPARFVATERFDVSWYPGEGLITYDLTDLGGKTSLTLTIRYETKEIRDGVLKNHMDMEKGIALSYDRLEKLLKQAG
jgi:uncharacterized protein YndB with AHSA1/START domain